MGSRRWLISFSMRQVKFFYKHSQSLSKVNAGSRPCSKILSCKRRRHIIINAYSLEFILLRFRSISKMQMGEWSVEQIVILSWGRFCISAKLLNLIWIALGLFEVGVMCTIIQNDFLYSVGKYFKPSARANLSNKIILPSNEENWRKSIHRVRWCYGFGCCRICVSTVRQYILN